MTVQQFDRGRHWRAKLGFIVLSNEETVEDDVFRLAPEGVGVHISRVQSADEMSTDTIALMKSNLRHSASLLLPGIPLDVICFTCSGGTMAMGEDVACAAMKEARPDAKATTVIGASIRALKHIGAAKISVLAPYPPFLNEATKAHLQTSGFELMAYHSLCYETNAQITNTSPEFIFERALEIFRPGSDALFICCGALRSLEIIDRLERQLNVPVIASNQAMMWDCLTICSITDSIPGYGRLLNNK